jgi:hypothetical protein
MKEGFAVFTAMFLVLCFVSGLATIKRSPSFRCRSTKHLYAYSQKIMTCLHSVQNHSQLCACEALIKNYIRLYNGITEADWEIDAMLTVLTIKKGAIRRSEVVKPIDIRYSKEDID